MSDTLMTLLPIGLIAVVAAAIWLITRRRGMAKANSYRNPANGYVESFSLAWLWCLLFGPIYFAVKGVWTHVVASLLLAICTAGFSWFVYPFFAGRIVATHYLRRGWTPVGIPEQSTPSAS